MRRFEKTESVQWLLGGILLTDLMLSFIKKNFIWRTFFKFGMFYKHLCSIRQNLIEFREISRGKIYIIHIYENAIEHVLNKLNHSHL